jgi:hypothetical protein
LFFFGVFCLDYWHGWTAAERLYLFDYLKSGVRQKLPAAKTRYTLLEGVTAKGEPVLVTGDEIEPEVEDLKLIDAHRFAALKDVEAVLGMHGMVIDDHFVGGWPTQVSLLTIPTTNAGALPSPTLGGWATTHASLSLPLLLRQRRVSMASPCQEGK